MTATPPLCTQATNKEEKGKDATSLTAGIAVGCVALLTIVLVLILCRHKLPRTKACCAADESSELRTTAEHNREEIPEVRLYEEIQMSNQQANSGNTLPSVYATINPPADPLHYASVNFKTDSDLALTDKNTDTNKNGTLASDYSSISPFQGLTQPPPLTEQTLYSTIRKSEQ
ncbi:hypothetical protein PBY51_020462 [Eleginops maclovinus]|uniref:Uncharacterized protein n=1 Tax=Eleginops maclovinus TaxID=56733 RepID=A0AAN7XSQ1_ELEMC|nr:hypothetical protein PBY51_020462 [Eleginops maclovinus]